MSIYEFEVNPESKTIFEAAGISGEEVDDFLKQFGSTMLEIKKREGHQRVSRALELFIQDIQSNEKKHRFIICMFAAQVIDGIQRRAMMEGLESLFGRIPPKRDEE